MEPKDQAKELYAFTQNVRRSGDASATYACSRFVLAFQALISKHVQNFADGIRGRNTKFNPQPEANMLLDAASELMNCAPPGTTIPTLVLIVSETPDDREARRIFSVFQQLL